MEMPDANRPTNVPSLFNGTNFQLYSAMFIFLKNIGQAVSCGCEKKNADDFFVDLRNGKRIIGQAKSSNSGAQLTDKPHTADFEDGIRNLILKNTPNVSSLMITFNYYRPLGLINFYDLAHYCPKAYSQIPKEGREKIQSFLSIDDRTKFESISSKFSLVYIPFASSDEDSEKFRPFLELLKETFSYCAGRDMVSRRMLDAWFLLFASDASMPNLVITAQDLAAVSFVSASREPDGEFLSDFSFYASLSFSNKDELVSWLQSFLASRTLSFFDVNQIVQAFASSNVAQKAGLSDTTVIDQYLASLVSVPSRWSTVFSHYGGGVSDLDLYKALVAYLISYREKLLKFQEAFNL
jgi:hypothetical protein